MIIKVIFELLTKASRIRQEDRKSNTAAAAVVSNLETALTTFEENAETLKLTYPEIELDRLREQLENACIDNAILECMYLEPQLKATRPVPRKIDIYVSDEKDIKPPLSDDSDIFPFEPDAQDDKAHKTKPAYNGFFSNSSTIHQDYRSPSNKENASSFEENRLMC